MRVRSRVLGALTLLATVGCSHAPLRAVVETPAPRVAEAFLSAMTPRDNVDSPAAWVAPDGRAWVIATAKATDRLIVYDGETGATLRSV